MTSKDTKIEAVRHTAGPWRIEQDTTLIWGNCDPDDTSDRGMGYPIAECRITPIFYSSWAKGPTEDEGEANARLIAAAPDLLDALRDCLDRFVEAFPAASEYEPIKRGFAAIRKAEGRAS